MNTCCASCERDLLRAVCDGVSGLYNPDGPEILLCEGCWLAEEELVDSEGTNDLPTEIARYRANIRKNG